MAGLQRTWSVTAVTVVVALVCDCHLCVTSSPSVSCSALRVFTDRTLVEAYWMDGRVAMTSATKPEMAKSGLDQVHASSANCNPIRTS